MIIEVAQLLPRELQGTPGALLSFLCSCISALSVSEVLFEFLIKERRGRLAHGLPPVPCPPYLFFSNPRLTQHSTLRRLRCLGAVGLDLLERTYRYGFRVFPQVCGLLAL